MTDDGERQRLLRPSNNIPGRSAGAADLRGAPLLHRAGDLRKSRSSQWQSLDLYQSLDNVTRHPSLAHEGYYNTTHCCYMLWRMVETILVLALTGILTGFITLSVNLVVYHFEPMRFLIVSSLKDSHLLACSAYTAYVVLMSLASVLVVNNVCPESVGGGIPETKTVLSGLIWRPILSVRLIWAKMVGLVFALVAGLSVGKEGPFVHVAVAVAESLMQLRCFRHCRRNVSKRLDVLGCASAAGVAATFGTPFGGVLFSIEVTAHYYLVRNLPRAFLTAVFASLVYNLAGLKDTFSLFSAQNEDLVDYTYEVRDLLVCVVLGVVCGLAGSLFVGLISLICAVRNKILDLSLGPAVLARRRICVVLLVSLIVAPVTYLDLLYGIHGVAKTLTDYMFSNESIGLSLPLALYVPFKFLATVLSVTLPLPVGLFTPTFISGASIGRLYGEALAAWGPQVGATFSTLRPPELAVIGAAAFSSGVTRAISTAVIIFELSGPAANLRIPMSLAIIFAYFVGNRFTKNVYDVILDTNGIPSLPELPAELYMVSASQVMKPLKVGQGSYLTLRSTFREAEEVLARSGEPLVPVVDDDEHMAMQGVVLREDLRQGLEKVYSACGDGAAEDGHGFKRVSFGPAEPEPGPTGAEEGEGAVPNGHARGAAGRRRVRQRPERLETPGDIPIHFVVLKDKDRAEPVTPTNRLLAAGFTSADVIMDPAPYTIGDSMLLNKVDFSFRMLKLTQAYVLKSGRLVGVLTREGLTHYVGNREKKPMHRCLQLVGACGNALCCRGHAAESPRRHPVASHYTHTFAQVPEGDEEGTDVVYCDVGSGVGRGEGLFV